MIELLKKYIELYRNYPNKSIVYDNNNVFRFEHHKKWINNKTKDIDPRSEFIRIGLENYNLNDRIIYDIKKIPKDCINIDFENNTCRNVYRIVTKQVSYSKDYEEGKTKLLSLFTDEFKDLILKMSEGEREFGSIVILSFKHCFEDDLEFPSINFEWYEFYFYDLDEGIYTPTAIE